MGFSRSIGGGQGSGGINATSQGLGLGPGTAIAGPEIRAGQAPNAQGDPEPDMGAAPPQPTAAGFPSLKGRRGAAR